VGILASSSRDRVAVVSLLAVTGLLVSFLVDVARHKGNDLRVSDWRSRLETKFSVMPSLELIPVYYAPKDKELAVAGLLVRDFIASNADRESQNISRCENKSCRSWSNVIFDRNFRLIKPTANLFGMFQRCIGFVGSNFGTSDTISRNRSARVFQPELKLQIESRIDNRLHQFSRTCIYPGSIAHTQSFISSFGGFLGGIRALSQWAELNHIDYGLSNSCNSKYESKKDQGAALAFFQSRMKTINCLVSLNNSLTTLMNSIGVGSLSELRG
jgi:hypothetical protein